MTHKFNVQRTLIGATIQDVRQLLAQPAFHESVCRKVPSTNLKIIESSLKNGCYRLKREHNLDVNIPDIAKKFLKDAFKLWRDDVWEVDALICRTHFRLNMPAEFRCKVTISAVNNEIVADHDWEVDVHVPLIRGILARHAESEIRRFNLIEIETIQKEIDLLIAGRGNR